MRARSTACRIDKGAGVWAMHAVVNSSRAVIRHDADEKSPRTHWDGGRKLD
jgi:hypothetical protein